VSVRVVAATNRDLAREVAENRFRQDCFTGSMSFRCGCQRCASAPGTFPRWPLRLRSDTRQRIGRPVAPLTTEDARRLQGYAWPGTCASLQNVIERAVITSVGNRLNLDRAFAGVAPAAPEAAPVAAVDATSSARFKELEEFERNQSPSRSPSRALAHLGEHGAAALLGMNPSTPPLAYEGARGICASRDETPGAEDSRCEISRIARGGNLARGTGRQAGNLLSAR